MLINHYSIKSTTNLIIHTWMVSKKLLDDNIFILWAETFTISIPVGVEDILDELHDGIDVADDFRLGGPPRQRGHRSGGVGQLGRRRLRGGRGLVGGVGAGEEAPAAGQCGRGCGGARREGAGPEEERPRGGGGAGECRCQGHAAGG